MGCLKKLINSIILFLAIVGFVSIGGNDFVQKVWKDYKIHHSESVEKKATKFGDFSKIGDEFEISKAASLFGYKGVVAEHKSSGQKMMILDTKNNDLITSDDIKNDKVEQKIEQLTKKFRAVKIQDLKIGNKGTMVVYGKSVPYVKFSAKISKVPFGEVDGMISSYSTENEHRLLVSINEKNKYSQLISQEFYKNIKK
jgi:hypothetical protein